MGRAGHGRGAGAWLTVGFVLARTWSRARAVRCALDGRRGETAAFSGKLLLRDGAALVATRAGLRVDGNVWVLGREARLQLPPGVHPMPAALELRPGALDADATITVVGAFRGVAQPGLRAASLEWPSGAALLMGDYREATTTLARRATRWTIVLLLPITLLATVTAGALMLDSHQYLSTNNGGWIGDN